MVEKNKGFQVGAHIAMVILSLCCIFPFLLLIMSSITDEQELIRNGYTLFPKALSLNAVLRRSCADVHHVHPLHQGEQHDLGAHHSVPYGQRVLRDHDAHVLLHEHSGSCY